MFTKFASLDVLEVKSSPSRVATASLSKIADFNDYRTDDGYVYVRVRAISSRVNKNNDGWPAAELQKAYRSFVGKPIFVDHHNTDPSKARGVVRDAALHVEDLQKTSALDPYYADAPEAHKPPTWIELLLEVDAKKFPRLAKAIVSGEIDSVSMGANVEMSKCSHCGNEAYSPEQFCKHVQAKGAFFDYTRPDGTKTSKKAYEDCHGVGFFEISFVFDPADETALVSDIKTAARREMIASIQKEGGPWDGTLGFQHMICPTCGQGGVNIGEPCPHCGSVNEGDGSYQPQHPGEEEFGDHATNQPLSGEEQTIDWVAQQFERLGYPPDQALQMAAQKLDYHEYEKLIGGGATGDQAHQILSSAADAYNDWQANPGQVADTDKEKILASYLAGLSDDELSQFAASRNNGNTSSVHFNVLRNEQRVRQMGRTAAEKTCPKCGGKSFDSNGACTSCGSRSDFDNPDTDKEWWKSASVEDAEFGDFIHEAQNPAPQTDMTTAPEKVNTLRQEQVCPICGSDMEDGICQVCNYEEPPEGFDNPDLGKANEMDEQSHQQDAEQAQQQETQNPPQQPVSPPAPGAQPGGPGATPTTSSAHSGAVSSEKTSANQGRVNTQERPILPVTRQLTDKPIAPKTISKGQKIESNRKDNDNNMTDITKTADGASALGQGVQAENRVDVLGVGGTGGDPLSGIDHENVEKDTGGFVAPHTDTWSGSEGDSLGQQDAVTSEVFEGGGQGSGNAVGVSSPPPHNSAYQVLADSSGDLGGPIGDAVGEGKGESGGPTWDSAGGWPDHDPTRVDLQAPLKEEVGDGTQTFGSDDFHITNPVTKDRNGNDVGGPIGTAIASAKAKLTKAFKVAEAEIALGLADPAKKFERVAELEDADEAALDGQLETLSRVKTAGLARPKTASTAKTAGVGRMPQFSKSAGFDIEAHSVADDDSEFAFGI